MLGTVIVPVKYDDQQQVLQALIVQGSGPNLLGRDWLKVTRLVWNKIFQIGSDNAQSALKDVLERYSDVFAEGLGTLKGVKAKIYADQGAKLKYNKARSVSYALRANVEVELERLEREGIISPVEFWEWAAPIVPVAKPNGTLRGGGVTVFIGGFSQCFFSFTVHCCFISKNVCRQTRDTATD